MLGQNTIFKVTSMNVTVIVTGHIVISEENFENNEVEWTEKAKK